MKVNYNDLKIELDKYGVHQYYLEGKLFTGIACEFDQEGILLSESSFRNGLEHGISKIWYEGGAQLYSITHYCSSHKHGESNDWYESGKLKKTEIYDLGILIRSDYFDENGEISKKYRIEIDSPDTLKSLNRWKATLKKRGFKFD